MATWVSRRLYKNKEFTEKGIKVKGKFMKMTNFVARNKNNNQS